MLCGSGGVNSVAGPSTFVGSLITFQNSSYIVTNSILTLPTLSVLQIRDIRQISLRERPPHAPTLHFPEGWMLTQRRRRVRERARAKLTMSETPSNRKYGFAILVFTRIHPHPRRVLS